ncbi:hypothetical protein AVEN_186093-1 [Araneus ventricosus]|uniref:Uncharacterized protein n=1 Tax=Araneus ventricosus TaxID=182803 RepID=A0A4Y2KAH8_ARAVE|nr:hypothetical protein AVEN_186093-1 [Araneus ventricosus]
MFIYFYLTYRKIINYFAKSTCWNLISQISVLVCSNLALQICSKFDTVRMQAWNKFEVRCCKQRSHHTSNLQQACCVKLIANYSKNRVQRQPLIRTPDMPLPKPVVFTTQLDRL